MNKTRKNLRTVKRGGGNNNNNNNNNNNKNRTPRRKIPYNWRPTRRLPRPVYLNSKLASDKIYKKYMIDGDSLDLSHFQNILLTGSDREKEEARRDLKYLLVLLHDARSDFKSASFNVLMLIVDGVALIPTTALGDYFGTKHIVEHAKDKVKEIKLKLSIDDAMQSIKKLLKETDFEITTTNPLVYKKARNSAKAANIVERDGKLIVEPKNNSNINNEEKF